MWWQILIYSVILIGSASVAAFIIGSLVESMIPNSMYRIKALCLYCQKNRYTECSCDDEYA